MASRISSEILTAGDGFGAGSSLLRPSRTSFCDRAGEPAVVPCYTYRKGVGGTQWP